MNVFVLDEDPCLAARYHCDKHLAKMVLETAQLLSGALPYQNGIYRPTHLKHPCAIWTRESHENFMWLAMLGISLGDEYTQRFDKTHKSVAVITTCMELEESTLYLPRKLALSPFAQCMADQYKVPGNPVQAYRNYYIGDKARFATWKNSKPSWWPQAMLPTVSTE